MLLLSRFRQWILHFLGNLVKALIPNSLKETIDVTNFSSGVYIAKISTLSGTGSMRLIIQ
tara:strand:- start:13589 stop:13768 length:180 start_codon:yes stop_codon:yes gene_type:complete